VDVKDLEPLLVHAEGSGGDAGRAGHVPGIHRRSLSSPITSTSIPDRFDAPGTKVPGSHSGANELKSVRGRTETRLLSKRPRQPNASTRYDCAHRDQSTSGSVHHFMQTARVTPLTATAAANAERRRAGPSPGPRAPSAAVARPFSRGIPGAAQQAHRSRQVILSAHQHTDSDDRQPGPHLDLPHAQRNGTLMIRPGQHVHSRLRTAVSGDVLDYLVIMVADLHDIPAVVGL